MPRGFETVADTIIARWTADRDTWVAPSELDEARAYLAAHGVSTHERDDGTFLVEGEVAAVCSAARVVLLGLRRLHAVRRRDRGA